MPSTPSAVELQCYTILQAAVSEQFGIIVETNDPNRARQALYHARKVFGEKEFEKVQIRASPDNPQGELWLIRREPTLFINEASEKAPINWTNLID